MFAHLQQTQQSALSSYLRNKDPKFACVRLPYYDIPTAYVRQAAGECANLYECSDILQEIGLLAKELCDDKCAEAGDKMSWWDMLPVAEQLGVNREVQDPLELLSYPFTDDCDDKNVCGYTVRSDMTTKPVPSAAGFASFLSIVHSSATYATFLMGIQFGVHNEIHNAVGGTMATFVPSRHFLLLVARCDRHVSVHVPPLQLRTTSHGGAALVV
ncbi:hypothetical protein PHMEG_00024159 [Phytophthora megakarya]|uniref:Uncharacterized protein n=1 Tax=Phytophthora megakarya TaxID=4795 RepID=A0A225VGM0_9STRA|nr:hypothetical protein PHMEG_00024159 [Phytophthora megakarya]